MPASIGSGLLFELCHDAVPAEFLEYLSEPDGHSHHHGADDETSAHDTDACDIGHMLAHAYIDSDTDADLSAPEFVTPAIPTRAFHLALAPRYRQAPRGPPSA